MNKQQALINMIHNKYEQIIAIEQRFSVLGVDGDYRCRIEHYHDAIRCLNHDNGLERNSRLAAEKLADDVEMLRQITTRPFIVGRGEQHLSVGNELTLGEDAGRELRPDANVKRNLTAIYRDYTVFFIALMIEKAEDNINARNEENDVLVQDCYRLEQVLAALDAGKVDLQAVAKAANMMENDGLRQKIIAMLSQNAPSSAEIKNSISALQNVRRSLNDERKNLDAAGMRLASSQLMVYEGAKDVVKQLMQGGVNIVGKHTESAVQPPQTSKDRGI